MTVTRANIADYLDTQFSGLAQAVGQNTLPIFGYKPDIDNALRRLGVSEDELAAATVADGKRDDAFALAEYYAARRFWRQLSDRANVSVGGNSFNFAHLLANAKALVDEAATRVAALGYDVRGDAWGVGYLNLDFLEPAP